MNETLLNAFRVYGVGTFVTCILGAAMTISGAVEDDEDMRKWGARMILFCAVWPVGLAILLWHVFKWLVEEAFPK